MDKQPTVYYFLQYVIKTLIYSRLWVAFCVFAFTQTAFILFTEVKGISVYSVILSLGSYLLYVLPFLYYGFKGVIRASNPRQLWVEKRLSRLYITTALVIVATIVMAFFYFDYFLRLLSYSIPVYILTVLYELPLLRFRGRFMALRQIGWLKPFLLAFVWWYMGGYIVAIDKADNTSCLVTYLTATDKWLLCLQYLLMLVLSVIFDVRDVESDRMAGIRTWPVGLGIESTQRVLLMLCLFGIAIAFTILPLGVVLFSYAGVFVVLTVFCLLPLHKMPWWFYDIAVDGIMVLQWVLLLICV